ncbi:hypothetical protein H2201_008330 [Coniosporium apollinis]|uniref:Mfs allantoate protein n=1 Tax=Coniosporium apollinis TaxID=61459 RepID=A0ABQ9NK06_9PEZI|nr:hypothetical protein H2201_008330 [Coniosporium apollinis]
MNGLFCMYKGYKRRNAKLDALVKSPPAYLAQSSVPLVNQTFQDVEWLHVLKQLYEHLSERYRLLSRVILARKLHHEHFFSKTLDYGHAQYLAKLQREKLTALRALERLERRTAEVLYQQEKWFGWVRQRQNEEEDERAAQAAQVKKEAAMFKRYRKELERRTKELKKKEDLKRQEEYLNEAYRERMSQEEEEEEWDPVEDCIEDERGTYIDLIKYFLMLKDSSEEDGTEEENGKSSEATGAGNTNAAEASNGSKTAKKRAKKAKSSQGSTETSTTEANQLGENNITMETKSEIEKRLREGVEYAQGGGLLVRGTIENPIELAHKTAPIPEEEIKTLLADIAEIKHLLFCRLLLSHASLLPAALRADSVEDFLNDKEVAAADLRDLCLKMEKPGLQEVRDACADLIRGEEEDEPDQNDGPVDNEDEDSEARKARKEMRPRFKHRRDAVPEVWHTKREKEMLKRRAQSRKMLGEAGATMVDFGTTNDEGEAQAKRMRVKVCGRYIYNYPSEKALTRGGWFHFSIIAKDSSFYDAIQLCRNWDEFFELNVLAIWQYFPAAKWLGFIPYFQFDHAAKTSVHHQTGSRGQGRRSHAMVEARNFMCAHIKRNDAASRRFIQYLSVETSLVVCLVRDAVTGKTLVSPPEEQLWLLREKSGLGRASKNEWNVIAQVGPKFFEDMERYRRWHFSFNEYYDVYVWDAVPGQKFYNLHNTIQGLLIKAHRFHSVREFYEVEAPILKTLVRDKDTQRARDAKPGERTIYDSLNSADTHFKSWNEKDEVIVDTEEDREARGTFYNEADAAEDRMLFPEELSGSTNELFKENMASMNVFEKRGPDFNRFAADLDTDEELESDDGEHSEGSLCPSCRGSGDDHDHNHHGEHSDEWVSDDTDADADDGWFSGPLAEYFAQSAASAERGNQAIDVTKYFKAPPELDPANMEREFMSFIDREKSKVFKEGWHKADLEPGAQLKYSTALRMVKRMATYNLLQPPARTDPFFKFLKQSGGVMEHRRVVPDMLGAFAAMSLFFTPEFLSSDSGTEFQDSLLVKQAERAKQLPDRRRYDSNKYMPNEFWKDWDTVCKRRQPYPFEWDIAIRPIIAHLYKSGVITMAYEEQVPGKAIAAKEPGRGLDLYIDFRQLVKTVDMPPELQDPTKVTREGLLNTARGFARANPNARFAVLRIWSAPHFYPLMIGYDRRWTVSFADAVGRHWEWKFIPKDMPCSEWSIHHQARLRIRPYQASFGKKVIVKRDMYLVMGEDEVDLLKLAAAVTYAAQTEPWRLEIDLWRSFVNVDLAFLEGLHHAWMD